MSPFTVKVFVGSNDDGNVDGGADSRVGLWTVDSMAAEDTITTISGTKTFTLRYISSAFGQTAGDGKGFFDTNTAVDLTEGQGVFVGYLNPDSDGIDTRVINFTIWTNPSKGLL